MSKKKWFGILAIFFLIQAMTSSPVLSFESSPLNPPINAAINTYVPILYEGTIVKASVTFQVLPSINEILSGCKIKPYQIYSSSEVNRSL